ncbi:hypothetical protein P170DRAFT_199525 [Aspergillus steynii IBT 23096]|uniref:Uncharacterized protein n=1 Tax=Aspergillus steynii IBT 23096 TaxID=1392250 RepID=A0A2I2G4T9_9EURO|nr:uncharacterized protein P170DRAFT_199525 [Aspergillus steynii IBT 23096]PLB47895.1 hypothetical protein P170DRAFT_199525 [Aspergillus steynii IBT 23096]
MRKIENFGGPGRQAESRWLCLMIIMSYYALSSLCFLLLIFFSVVFRQNHRYELASSRNRRRGHTWESDENKSMRGSRVLAISND